MKIGEFFLKEEEEATESYRVKKQEWRKLFDNSIKMEKKK